MGSALGFFIRKGINVGPFRFNLSKSGIGLSAGVTGLRVGTGPRGNYVHGGRHGLYYRKSLNKPSRRGRRGGDGEYDDDGAAAEDYTLGDFAPIDSGDVTRMVDESSADLLDEIAEKRRMMRLWPVVAWASAGVLAMTLFAGFPLWAIGGLGLLSAAGTAALWQRDVARKTVVIMYDLDGAFADACERFHDAFEKLAACGKVWHVLGHADVTDEKYHGGAESVLKRNPITLTKGQVPGIRTNVEVPQIRVGTQTLAFLPDRLLVVAKDGVGAVAYDALRVHASRDEWPVQEAMPPDAETVGQTWRYVNKDGTPDRRFKDNAPVPICAFGDLHITSDTGLNERVQCSRPEVAKEFAKAVNELALVHNAAETKNMETPSEPERLEVTCPQCERTLRIPREYAGQRGTCNHCGGPLTVPG